MGETHVRKTLGGAVRSITNIYLLCGPKYIEFESGSRVIRSILKEKIKNNFRENNFLYKKYII